MLPEPLWPYGVLGQAVGSQPGILGSPMRTEFYRARETQIEPSDGPTPGAEWQFTRNGVVTGIQLRCSVPLMFQNEVRGSWGSRVEILKNGVEHVFTDGKRPSAIEPGCFSQVGEGFTPCFIPVDSGEIWRVRMLCRQDFIVPRPFRFDYSVVVRVERFEEVPKVIPDWLTQTLFYVLGEDELEKGASRGQEWDFRADGEVTGLGAAATVPGDFSGLLTGIELDMLIDGTVHLSNGYQTIFPLDVAEIKPLAGPMLPFWHCVSQHQKWQVFARNNFWGGEDPIGYRAIARVEERRRPWERW